MSIQGVAINPIGQKQFVDHLAPLAAGLNIPYLFHDREEEKMAKRLYPELQTIFLPYEEFCPEYLISHFDCTFLSDQWEKKVFDEKFFPLEQIYGKKMRNVHCPHGFSDKGFYLRGVAFEDISLIYGQNMLDLLKEWGVLTHLRQFVICGNYRFAYYKKHQSFYEQIIQQEIEGYFEKKQRTILYAPTCADLEDSSSFFSLMPILLETMPDHLNIIIKPHPRLEQDDPANFYHIVSQCEGRKNVLFLTDFPLIYPLLQHCDIYLGDMSSIGYDFLAFDRPLFFLNQQKRNPKEDRGLYLFRCGTVIEPEEYRNLFSIMTNTKDDFSEIRKKVYQYTFGEAASFEKMKKDLAVELAKNDFF